MLCDDAWLAASTSPQTLHPFLRHLQAVDEGQEQHALEAALVQGIRRAVGGGHQHHPQLPQLAARGAGKLRCAGNQVTRLHDGARQAALTVSCRELRHDATESEQIATRVHGCANRT